MEIEFDCGAVATNVGHLGLALQHHIEECSDVACQDDCREMFLKYA